MRLAWAMVMLAGLATAADPNLLPLPAKYTAQEGSLRLDRGLRIELGASARASELAALKLRLEQRLEAKRLAPATAASPALTLRVVRMAGAVQQAVEDESYKLTVSPAGASLDASTPYGILRGAETFLQLVQGTAVPSCVIEDSPRFPWRGLHLDVARHFIPPDQIRRVIDGMSLVKLNVLHLHLTDDQGFRFESKLFPALHEKGSSGQFYTQAQLRELIGYARLRGIRVMPEFDMPGHTTAWFAGMPELASLPGPYKPETQWGIFDPAMNPAKESVYQFLDRFLGEVAAVFPDPFLHIGGDEVNGKAWDANPEIQAFKKEKGFKTNHDLQHYFISRVEEIVTRKGKTMIGWDEILHPELRQSTWIQAWRGHRALLASVAQQRKTLVSYNLYLDWSLPAEAAYMNRMNGSPADPNDFMERFFAKEVPLPPGVTAGGPVKPQDRQYVMGGEGALWTETTDGGNVHTRLWPRLGAMAERFWSPASVDDADSLYARFGMLGDELEKAGIPWRTSYESKLADFARGQSPAPLRILAEALEPGKYTFRNRRYSVESPLTGLVDAIPPESLRAWTFRRAAEKALSGSGTWAEVRAELDRWRTNDSAVKPLLSGNPALADVVEPASRVARTVEIGLRAVAALEKRQALPPDAAKEALAYLDKAGSTREMYMVAIAPTVKTLVQRAGVIR